ncbi:VanZ family protein [Serpentinicella sp. ANB-PHB4]|uniref:VanZ family protein n=1 Tax=Serpentinicella sp. ANB-PHB4 TaxID=3074076 RepID=UPI002859426A|nr:VanZ family protein [Serpentinicella sp. ANB-PHB4]MDR5658440.1 VanZ family protein [Serpentinicella sp. ANB-PHB4]
MYRIDIVPIGSLLLVLYIISDFFKHKKSKLLKRIVRYSFIFYLLYVVQVTTGGINIPPLREYRGISYQLVPFKFLQDWVEMYNRGGTDWFFLNSVKLSLYNLVMLLPLGIYFPVLFHIKSFKKVVLYTMLTSLTIEIYQLIFSYYGLVLLRTANIDDIILNTVGGIIGYFIYRIVLSKWIHRFIA